MSIGVVIPAYRAADTLKRTIVSCLPHVRPHDIVVVLDGPDDRLEEVARNAAQGIRIMTLPTQQGAPVCRNEGLALIDTDYVMFMDSDDYVEGPLLAAASECARAADADVALAPFCLEAPDGARRVVDPSDRYAAFDRGFILRKWLIGDYVPPCAIVWRADFVRSIGGWDETLAKNQDGDLMYRALLADANVVHCRKGLGVYVQGDDPDRITRRNNERTLTSQLMVLERIREQLPRLQFDPTCELALAYYSLARLAFEGGVDAVGRHAEAAARELGLAGQHGNRVHVVVASLLGLRRKQLVANFVRKSVLAIAS